MLEIKNVTRVYKPKKGAPVVALDDVSLKFAETGMVFLLGKSGSGKSTLLNVMGGLDKYDKGEIIIKAKSSKDFSQSDFDSYRNTYLGFIFQEYNILNEFTVGANIGLALELQGKKATNNAVNEILQEVDLVGYASRKPSELSGGQKQRVAIARALVKSPEIIMADEPTGALDSNTGIQVFDTLKKLSKDKLVIVVTHDREFAEYYGDRVIELKDGKVISDIEKYTAESEKKNENISIIDNKIIQIKKGYTLTAQDLKLINDYIAENDAILSVDSRTNTDIKKFARIDNDGNREAFKDTDESTIPPIESGKFKLIKSKLPFKNSFRIGASSLKNKPFRLFVTILLSMVAFSMFGLADTLGAYNKYTTTRTSIVDSNVNSLALQKANIVHNEDINYSWEQSINSGSADIALLKDKLGLDFEKVYLPVGYNNDYNTLTFNSSLNSYDGGPSSYSATFGGFLETDTQKLQQIGFSTIYGTMPKDFEEIAVSEYVYRHFAKYGYRYEADTVKANEIKNPQDFLALSPKIKIQDVDYTITAIVDTNFDYAHFDSLNDPDTNMMLAYLQMEELKDTVNYSYHGLIFVKSGFIDNILADESAGIRSDYSQAYMNFSTTPFDDWGGSSSGMSFGMDRIYNLSQIKDLYNYYLPSGKTTLAKNEFMISFNLYHWIINSYYNSIANYDQAVYIQILENEAPQWYFDYEFGYYLQEEFGEETYEEYQQRIIDNALSNGSIMQSGDAFPEILYSYIAQNNNTTSIKNTNHTLVGVFYTESYDHTVAIDNDLYEQLAKGSEDKFAYLIAKMPTTTAELDKVIKFCYDYAENDVKFNMKNGVMSTLSMVNELIEALAKVFLYIGIGFAVFSAVMLMNYIATSISYKRREIGILRAVGARSSDVFGIFFNESLLIAVINFLLATIATFVTVSLLNNLLRTEYNIVITLLNFGFRQVLLMLGISVIVAFVASFLPVYKVAKQRPIDAIKK